MDATGEERRQWSPCGLKLKRGDNAQLFGKPQLEGWAHAQLKGAIGGLWQQPPILPTADTFGHGGS